jgi:hypothetical protein
MTTTTPQQAVQALRSRPTLPDGNDERFAGYGVMGIPFASGHYLALRDMLASSVGPAYRAIWHRDPEGRWSIHTTGAPELTCPRYFGSVATSVRVPSIDVVWRDDHTIDVSLGDEFAWRIDLAATAATGAMSAMGGAMPEAAWNSEAVLAAMEPMASGVLRVGRVRLRGATPNGPRFKAAPRTVWRATGRASIRGQDLGDPRPLPQQTGLGDFWLPQRGLFFVGGARFTRAGDRIPTTPSPAAARMGR